jgi:aryl-alcohol dehydrogenase-like predicted oxidoreductase
MAELVKAGRIGTPYPEAHAIHPLAAVQTEFSPMMRNPEIAVSAACTERGITLVTFRPWAEERLAVACVILIRCLKSTPTPSTACIGGVKLVKD